jgi:hypothetical protein
MSGPATNLTYGLWANAVSSWWLFVPWTMAIFDPVLIDLPMPISTPRLTIRPKQVGDGAITSSAVLETWEELNRWMRWAENRDSFYARVDGDS